MYKKKGNKIQNNRNKFFIVIPAVILVGFGIWILAGKLREREGRQKEEAQVYEALVQVVDQTSGNPAEDAKSSLKKGDVIAVFPEGHSWTETERISYLILKLRLKGEDVQKLTEAEEKEVAPENGPGGERVGLPRKEIITARKYRLKVEKLKYDPQKLYEGQPYPDKIFDEDMIEEK